MNKKRETKERYPGQEEKFTWNVGDVTITFPTKEARQKAIDNRKARKSGDSK